jgi:Superinfection immunity protein
MRHASAAALLLSMALASTALSADITTANGTLFHDARVTAVDPDGLHIAHKFGVAKIPFEELPEDLRTKYHYDKQKADAYRQQLRARQRSTTNRSATTQSQAPAVQQTRPSARGQNQKGQQLGGGEYYRKQIQRVIAIIVSSGLSLAILGLGIVIYFLPTFVGLRKQNAVRIFMLNLLLGWTLAGWIAAFIWACRSESRPIRSNAA